MFNKLIRIFNYIKLKIQNKLVNDKDESKELIPNSIKTTKTKLDSIFSDCSDFITREFNLGNDSNIRLMIAYIDGLIVKKTLNDDILKSLMIESRKSNLDESLNQNTVIDIVKNNILNTCEIKELRDFEQTINLILSGNTVIYINDLRIAIKVDTRGWDTRNVEEPDTESVVRGPREGFTETLRTNTSLLRRKIKNPKLKTEMITLGRQTNTDICICYIKGIAHEDVLETVRRRLKKIKIDTILESGYIEQFIEDAPYSIFPTVANSEKPDIVAGKILEGRVAILCDGTPFVLTVPHLFIESLISNEDYYTRTTFANLSRLLRLLALFLTCTLPAFYVAMVSFHQEVIPFKLLLTIAASREGIPFSAFTETLLMGIAYELLREAGVRMPRPIGQAVSIVGGLVLGQAAVEAGITSNPVIMITALTAITSFMLPTLRGPIPYIRLSFLFAANFLGILGMGTVAVFTFIHMCTLRSFGVPYLAPFAPFTGMDLKDTFIRTPLWSMWTRPLSLIKYNKNIKDLYYRMNKDIKTKED